LDDPHLLGIDSMVLMWIHVAIGTEAKSLVPARRLAVLRAAVSVLMIAACSQERVAGRRYGSRLDGRGWGGSARKGRETSGTWA
jgi:hypothetical protein